MFKAEFKRDIVPTPKHFDKNQIKKFKISINNTAKSQIS